MDHFTQSIDALLTRIKEQETQINKNKTAVNALCACMERPPMFVIDDQSCKPITSTNLTGDEYYGQPLSTVIRTILESRKVSGGQGAASVNDLYATMVEGGFKFDTTDPDNAKRNLRISLTKNSQTFHKLPNGKYGLREWYPAVKDKKPGTGEEKEAAKTAETEADDGFNFEEKEKEADAARAPKPNTAAKATA